MLPLILSAVLSVALLVPTIAAVIPGRRRPPCRGVRAATLRGLGAQGRERCACCRHRASHCYCRELARRRRLAQTLLRAPRLPELYQQ